MIKARLISDYPQNISVAPNYQVKETHEDTMSNIDELIARTKSILNQVKNETRHSTVSSSAVNQSYHDNFRRIPNAAALTSDIDLLLNGVPEGFDLEAKFEDEAIDKILREAGDPPSRLRFPTIYANNQMIMEKLRRVKKLRISISDLLIYSSRYGVRKEGSFLRLTPPRTQLLVLPVPVTIPLYELNEEKRSYTKNDATKGQKKGDILKAFFCGEAHLSNKVYVFEVEITDDIIQLWGKAESCLEIELFTPLFSQKLSSKQKGLPSAESSIIRVAKATVPLDGLLGIPSLDATVKADFIVDPMNFPTIRNRIESMSVGKLFKPLGDIAGLIALTVTLMPDDTRYIEGKRLDNLLIPNGVAVGETVKASAYDYEEKIRENAAGFVPVEKVSASIETFEAERKVLSNSSRYFGVFLGGINCQKNIRKLEGHNLKLIISYRLPNL